MRPNGRFAFWAVWAVFAFGFLVCRWTLFDSVFYNVDEAEYAVGAEALSNGMLPGLDLVGSTKPPAIVLLYKVLFAVVGESLVAIQVLGFILWLAALALTMKLAHRLFPEAPIWMTALSFFLLANSFGPPRDLHALNVELPGIVLILAAFLRLIAERSNQNILLSGLCFGLAVMFRQSFVFFLLPVVLLMWPLRFAYSARFVIAAAVPWVVLLIPYAFRDGLDWTYDSWFRFPMLYAGDTGLSGFVQAGWYTTLEIIRQAFIPFGFAILGIVLAVRRMDKFLIAFAVASVLAVSSGSRFFEHYYIQAFPVLALLSTFAIRWLMNRGKVSLRIVKAALAVGALMALLHFPFWRSWDTSAPPKTISAESLDLNGIEIELGQFAAQQTLQEERIFVWGYCPQIYFHADRLPAVRDFLCEYVTGYSPFSTSPRAFARPDAMQMMLEDLERTRPKIIFDLSFVDIYQYSFVPYPLTNYPLLADFIRANYRPVAQVGQVPVYQLASN